MHQVFDWLSANPLLVSAVAALSIALVAVTILAMPRVVSRLPSDYLLKRLEGQTLYGFNSALVRVLRGVLGLFMVLFGMVMLITPGPGVIMLLLGISVADFPGKNRLLVYLATRPSVLASLNWMRQRHDKPPFIDPGADHQ